jgi:hypothetical protein
MLSGSGTIAAGMIFITISNFIAPPSSLQTDNFTLTINSQFGFPKMVSYQTITATPDTLSGTATANRTTVNLVSSYTFSITMNDPITS